MVKNLHKTICLMLCMLNLSNQIGFPTYLIFLWQETYFDISLLKQRGFVQIYSHSACH